MSKTDASRTEERTGTVYNSTLKRRKPLVKGNWSKAKKASKSGEFRSPRKPLKKVSRQRKTQLDKYLTIRKAFLAENPRCVVCLLRGFDTPSASDQVHHMRGRRGPLLCDTRYFLAVDAECHHHIHSNAVWSREQGLLSSLADWNKLPID